MQSFLGTSSSTPVPDSPVPTSECSAVVGSSHSSGVQINKELMSKVGALKDIIQQLADENITLKEENGDLQKELSDKKEEKDDNVEAELEAVNLVRAIGCQKRRAVRHRDRRANMLGERVEWKEGEAGSEVGTLAVTGLL